MNTRHLKWPERPDEVMPEISRLMTDALFVGYGHDLARLLEKIGVCPRPPGDRSEPPEHYSVTRFTTEEIVEDDLVEVWGGWNIWGPDDYFVSPCVYDDTNLDYQIAVETSRRAAVQAAWEHFDKQPPKLRHDPPGLVSHEDRFCLKESRDGLGTILGRTYHVAGLRGLSRVAAWDWYIRRLEIHEAMSRRALQAIFKGLGNTWPAVLAWTDEQVTDVERWMANPSSELPEVFHAASR